MKTLPGQKHTSESAFLKMRCAGRADLSVAEIRRQLRVLKRLTLPPRPAPKPKPRKRPAAK